MKKTVLNVLLFLASSLTVLAQVGIGTQDPQAALDITSDKGLLIPRMTDHSTLVSIDGTLDANEEGLVVYNTTTNTIMLWDGIQWKPIDQGALPLWQSNSNGGIYATNDIVNHGGVLYRNKTGSNTNFPPNLNPTDWEAETRDAVPFWKSLTNGGVYSVNEIINRNGFLYKNKTGTNSDTTPNIDDTNWVRVDQLLGLKVSIGGGILMRHNWPSIGWNLGIDADGDDKFYTSNPSYRMIMPTSGSDSGILQFKGTATGTAGEKRSTVPEVVHASFSPDSNFRLNGILNTDTFSTEWESNTNGGSYLTNAIVIHDGAFYKNLTGTNTDVTPNLNTTNWETIIGGQNESTGQYESGEQVFNGAANGYNAISVPAETWQDLFTFTLPSAGTWRLSYPVIVESLAGQNVTAAIKQNGNIVPNSEIVVNLDSANYGWGASTGITEVTTTGAETLTLSVKSNTINGSVYSLASGRGVTKVSWEKVAGLLPVSEEQYFTEVSYTATPFNLVGGFEAQTAPYDSVDESLGGAGSWFDIATHRFTPQKAGWWRITASFDIYRGLDEETSISILKNGPAISNIGGFGLLTSSTTKEVYLNGTTDYVEVMNYGSVATSRDQAPHTSFFQARWVGE